MPLLLPGDNRRAARPVWPGGQLARVSVAAV